MRELPFDDDRATVPVHLLDQADDVTTPRCACASGGWAAATAREAISDRPPPPSGRDKRRPSRAVLGGAVVVGVAILLGAGVLARDVIAREIGIDPVAFARGTGGLVTACHPRTAEARLAIAAAHLRQGIEVIGARPGVRVSVDGRLVDAGGLVPLDPGRHVVKLAADHYRPVEHTVVVAPGQVLSLGPLMLEVHKVALTVEVDPPGSAVQLYSGRQRLQQWTGANTVSLLPGSYRVVAAKPGRQLVVEPLVLTGARDSHHLRIRLAPAAARPRPEIFELGEEPKM